jgi:hypothetical protein
MLTEPLVQQLTQLRLYGIAQALDLSHIDSSRCDFFYSNIEYHDKHDRRFRVWNAGRFSMFKLKTGWMPPHTSVVVAKRIYRDFGVYNPAFGTAADYEWIVRVLSSNNASVSYYPQRTLTCSSAAPVVRRSLRALGPMPWMGKLGQTARRRSP